MSTETKSISVFDSPEALELNRARLEHLESLRIEITGNRVLDLGCGVGHLAKWFIDRGYKITCVDARPENIVDMIERYPTEIVAESAEAFPWNIENTNMLWRANDSGINLEHSYDIVLAYGLLYHLENPLAAIERMAELTKGILLLETIVIDSTDYVVRYEPEDPENPNQSVTGWGCRPSPSLVYEGLRGCFEEVAMPELQPDHADFRWSPQNDGAWQRAGNNLRRVFIASRTPLNL